MRKIIFCAIYCLSVVLFLSCSDMMNEYGLDGNGNNSQKKILFERPSLIDYDNSRIRNSHVLKLRNNKVLQIYYDEDDNNDSKFVIYDSLGNELFSPVKFETDDQVGVYSATLLANGKWVIVWANISTYTMKYIIGDESGSFVAPMTAINGNSASYPYDGMAVSLNNGGFVIISRYNGGFIQFFNEDGQPTITRTVPITGLQKFTENFRSSILKNGNILIVFYDLKYYQFNCCVFDQDGNLILSVTPFYSSLSGTRSDIGQTLVLNNGNVVYSDIRNSKIYWGIIDSAGNIVKNCQIINVEYSLGLSISNLPNSEYWLLSWTDSEMDLSTAKTKYFVYVSVIDFTGNIVIDKKIIYSGFDQESRVFGEQRIVAFDNGVLAVYGRTSFFDILNTGIREFFRSGYYVNQNALFE
ncbi:MAG: hypothetical protein JW982_08085 [Spirochaetes bacterium]|nr:hypothetical protein [Spirochaetota bacterium]